MNQLGLLFDQTEEAPETPADTTPTRTVTGLAEIKSETPPIDICSMESCRDKASRWVVFGPRGRVHAVLQRARARQPVVDPRQPQTRCNMTCKGGLSRPARIVRERVPADLARGRSMNGGDVRRNLADGRNRRTRRPHNRDPTVAVPRTRSPTG